MAGLHIGQEKLAASANSGNPAIRDCPFRIGNTAFRRLHFSINGLSHEILLKEELENEFGSTKDRVAWYLLHHALAENPGLTEIVDASSGNYGNALASIGQRLGLSVTIVSSPSISQFNAQSIREAGATLLIADAQAGESSNAARIRVAGDVAAKTGALFLNQYSNMLNPESHRVWTAPEVFSEGPLDACFVTASSGGTGRGFADFIDETGLATELIFVEPSGSKAFADPVPDSEKPCLPGYGTSRRSSFSNLPSHPHTIRTDEAAVIAGFSIFQDATIAPIGLSSVGIVLGALSWLETQDESRRIACVCADGANRYVDEFDSRYRPSVPVTVFDAACRELEPVLSALSPEQS